MAVPPAQEREETGRDLMVGKKDAPWQPIVENEGWDVPQLPLEDAPITPKVFGGIVREKEVTSTARQQKVFRGDLLPVFQVIGTPHLEVRAGRGAPAIEVGALKKLN